MPPARRNVLCSHYELYIKTLSESRERVLEKEETKQSWHYLLHFSAPEMT